jgi:pimeloyl-ACP methyl ester carboxylesterase
MTPSITISQTEWRYHVTGSGLQPLLILSGSLGATEGIASYLGEHLSGCRLIVPEYAPVQTVEEYLQALDSILDREQVRRFAILGGSFGGLIAQTYARLHPDRITHLILAGTSVTDPVRVRNHQRILKLLPWIPVGIIRSLLRLLLRRMLRSVSNPVWKQEYSQLVAKLSEADIVSRYQVALDLDRSYRFHPGELPDSIKVLIMVGEKDRIANATVRVRLREI